MKYQLSTLNIAKRFNKTYLFKDINFTIASGMSFSITGPNGSGKSTLLKILAGLLKPTQGVIVYSSDLNNEPVSDFISHIGYTGPLVNPYEDLTALENIMFAKKKNECKTSVETMLSTFDLASHKNKKVRHYSSGMKQRLKIIMAVINDPPVLIFDEPGTNLDEGGRNIFRSYLESIRCDKMIILATNDHDEADFCNGGVKLG